MLYLTTHQGDRVSGEGTALQPTRWLNILRDISAPMSSPMAIRAMPRTAMDLWLSGSAIDPASVFFLSSSLPEEGNVPHHLPSADGGQLYQPSHPCLCSSP